MQLMQGLRVRWNGNSGFTALELHYSADPLKRTEEWYQREQMANANGWDREYELAWRAKGGKAVYQEEFNPQIHVVEDIELMEERDLIVGWDYGRDPAAVFHQLTPSGGLNVVGEIIAPDRMGMETFLEIYFAYVEDRFPGWPPHRYKHCADPAGWSKGQASEKTAVDVQVENGIKPVKGPIPFSDRRDVVTSFMTKIIRGAPAYQVDSVYCPWLLEGLNGGYQYPKVRESFGTLPDKTGAGEKYTHAQDAHQYGAWLARKLQRRGEMRISSAPLKRKVKSFKPLRRRPGRPAGLGRVATRTFGQIGR